MRKSFRRPSPAMLVAVTALVSSFAGPAVADEVARMAQSITSSKQIRNGIVTGADLRNETVTATDIRNGGIRTEDIGTGQVQAADLATDSVRGDKVPSNTLDGSDIIDRSLRGVEFFGNSVGGDEILESSLGTVPNASQLGGRDASDYVNTSENRPFSVNLALGETATLGGTGAVSIKAECHDDGGGSASLRIFGATTAANSLLQGDQDDFLGGSDPSTTPGDYLQPDTPSEDAVIMELTSSSTFPEGGDNIDGGWVLAQDGSYAGIDNEGTANAVNVDGSRCFVAGNVRTNG